MSIEGLGNILFYPIAGAATGACLGYAGAEVIDRLFFEQKPYSTSDALFANYIMDRTVVDLMKVGGFIVGGVAGGTIGIVSTVWLLLMQDA